MVVDVISYLRFEWLLTFLTAGFVVQNFSRQGEKLLHAIENTGEVVYVIFFATAGAHLDLPLLKTLWPAALLFFAVRAATAVVGARLTARLAGDPPSCAPGAGPAWSPRPGWRWGSLRGCRVSSPPSGPSSARWRWRPWRSTSSSDRCSSSWPSTAAGRAARDRGGGRGS